MHPENTNESLKTGVLVISGMVLIRLDNCLHIVEAWRRTVFTELAAEPVHVYAL